MVLAGEELAKIMNEIGYEDNVLLDSKFRLANSRDYFDYYLRIKYSRDRKEKAEFLRRVINLPPHAD